MLKITNLNMNADVIPILEDINLEINEGEIHAIMGPSCSGKTTLANSIAGNSNLSIAKGKLNFKRKVLNTLQPNERSKLGIFLSAQYPPEISGSNNLQMMQTILKLRDDKRETTEVINNYKDLVKKFELGSEWTNREFNLATSIGEKKKHEVVQMFMLNPCLIILDEIEVGLDTEAIKMVATNINTFLKQKGKAAIVVTQDPKILEEIKPTHVHVMINGRIVKSGDKRIIKRIIQNGYPEFS